MPAGCLLPRRLSLPTDKRCPATAAGSPRSLCHSLYTLPFAVLRCQTLGLCFFPLFLSLSPPRLHRSPFTRDTMVSCCRPRARATCTKAVWCFCVDVLTTVLCLLCGCVLIALSWHAFIRKMKLRDVTNTTAACLEMMSVLLGGAGYWLVVDAVWRGAPMGWLTRVAVLMTRLCLGRSRQAECEALQDCRGGLSHRHLGSDEELGSVPACAPLKGPAAQGSAVVSATTTSVSVTAASAAPHRRYCVSLISAALLLLCVCGIHVVVHHIEPDEHRLSQELQIMYVRACADTSVVLVAVCGAAVRCLRRCVSVGLLSKRGLRRVCAVCCVAVVVVAAWVVSGTAVRLWRVDTYTHLTTSILGSQGDPCGAVGMVMNASVRNSIVWPAVLPRRLFNFFTGSELCDPGGRRHQLAWIDSDSHTLVVSPTCWDGKEVPRVYLARPVNNDLFIHPEVQSSAPFMRYMEAKYGNATSVSSGVVVHRDRRDGRITEVEVAPSRLTPVPRGAAAAGSDEARVRARWVSQGTVLALPLGESATYFVRCPRLDALYEEMYMYPMLGPASRASEAVAPVSAAATGTSGVGVTEPPGSVLFIVSDCTSRQEVQRSLPRFTSWLRDFRAREAAKGSEGYLVVEPRHHSIVGQDTVGNTAVFLTGASTLQWRVAQGQATVPMFDASPWMLSGDAKRRYGESRFRTSFTHGMCEEVLNSTVHAPVRAGLGAQAGSIDLYIYAPFCHHEYGATQGNFIGPYSCRRRCIDGRNVHQYLFDYTTYLMKHRMRRAATPSNASGEFFFDVTYMIDAHEGTHGALRLVDDDLTAFMTRLEKDVGFFKNPLNALVFGADHGSHMGYYYSNSVAGTFEHTDAAFVMAVHPKMLDRVDAMKHRDAGTSARNLVDRMSQFSSNLDTHRTLRDILGVPDGGLGLSDHLPVPPLSHFDRRDVVPHQCSDFRNYHNNPCSLSFCSSNSTR